MALEESKPLAFLIAIVVTAIVLTLGAAILAGVWKVETVGGTVLLIDCVLILIWCIAVPQFPPALLLPLILPPLLAGWLFIASNRLSKESKEHA